MSRLILLGSPGTRRTACLEKGAKAAGVEIELVDWADFPLEVDKLAAGRERCFMKIDPPRWDSCCLEELNGLTEAYGRKLDRLRELAGSGRICFLNTPDTIKALLDKRGCKRRLKEAGLPVTEEVDIGDREAAWGDGEYPLLGTLLKAMERQRIYQVFIKPNFGSGAAGVMALRYEPRRGQMALYTCGAEDPATGCLVNTRRLRRFEGREKIGPMVEKLLRLNCIVERWYAKAEHGRFSYDLRAVVQDGKIDFIVARLSSGPITNLQLNNHPLKAEELGLGPEVSGRVERICLEAVACFPGLRSAGIDILLEKGSLRPRIIEMNGQGDLIYQDIYHENRIYRRQCEMMKEWAAEEVPFRMFGAAGKKKEPSVDMSRVVGFTDILFICLDTLRYDVALKEEEEGGTPVLNRYGSWKKCQAPGNFTWPSHHAMFSGFFPSPYEAKNLADREMLFFPKQIGMGNKTPKGAYGFSGSTIMEGLEKDGYDTWCVGGVSFFDKRSDMGKVFPGYFRKSYWNPSFGCAVKDSAKNQVDFILKKLEVASPETRIFMYLNVDAIHYPNYFYLEETAHDSVKSHGAALRYADRELGRLFEGWKEKRGGAFVICCSDHGTCYGEDGCQFHGINHPIVNTVPYKHFFL